MEQSGRLLNLNWNNFGDNLSEAIKEMKNDKDFNDVSLLCDDGNVHFANKFILSVCSEFFKGLFKKIGSTQIVIYLKGVSSRHMESILDFIYIGSTTVDEDDLTNFLETAQDLKINGLIDPKERSSSQPETDNNYYISDSLVVGEQNTEGQVEVETSKALVSTPVSRVTPSLFSCTVCGKSFSYKHVLENHIETHMDNSYNCEICHKIFKTKNSLKSHLSQRHRNC